MYIPKHLKKWYSGGSYIGADYSEYYAFLCKADSDTDVLNASNYAIALNELGGESETVLSTCFKHFACGHFEQIMIHESDSEALKKSDGIAEKLRDYPVLDDDDYSNREVEAYNQDLESWAYDDACRIIGIDGDSLKPKNKSRIERACLDCFYYYGNAHIDEGKLWESLKESKEIVPFSWVEYEKSKGQGFLKL